MKELTFHDRLCFSCQHKNKSCQKLADAPELNQYLAYENVLRLATYDWSISDLAGYEFACEYNLEAGNYIKAFKIWPIVLGFMLPES